MENEGQTPLSSLLSDDEPVQETVVEGTAPEPEPDTGQPRDEGGRFARKGEDEGASPAPVTEDAPYEHAAVKGERSRRQAAERERDEFRARLEALEQKFTPQQQQEQPGPPPSIWEDEAATFQHYGGQIVGAATRQSRLDTSEMLAAQAFPDFQEVWEPMNRFLMENPAVAQKATADRHPWAYAYKAYKNAATMQELGATDLDSLKAKMREEIMAEMQAQPAPAPGLPPTLSTERNVGSRSGPAWSGPKPLSELLG